MNLLIDQPKLLVHANSLIKDVVTGKWAKESEVIELDKPSTSNSANVNNKRSHRMSPFQTKREDNENEVVLKRKRK